MDVLAQVLAFAGEELRAVEIEALPAHINGKVRVIVSFLAQFPARRQDGCSVRDPRPCAITVIDEPAPKEPSNESGNEQDGSGEE